MYRTVVLSLVKSTPLLFNCSTCWLALLNGKSRRSCGWNEVLLIVSLNVSMITPSFISIKKLTSEGRFSSGVKVETILPLDAGIPTR